MMAKIRPRVSFSPLPLISRVKAIVLLCALIRVCPIGCVYQSVPGDSGATAGVVRGATPPVRAALGAAVTSALPVNLGIT